MALKRCVRQSGPDVAANPYQGTSGLNAAKAPSQVTSVAFLTSLSWSRFVRPACGQRGSGARTWYPRQQAVLPGHGQTFKTISPNQRVLRRESQGRKQLANGAYKLRRRRPQTDGLARSAGRKAVFACIFCDLGPMRALKIFSASPPRRGSNRLSTVYITNSCATRFA